MKTSFGIILILIVLLIVKLPNSELILCYYDDGETLYHTLALLSGQVPYLEVHTHHFIGYVLPYLLAAKVIGFSANLVYQISILQQFILALGLYYTARFYCSRSISLLAAILVIVAREPWVLGYAPLQQINYLMVWIWFCSLSYNKNPRILWLYLAALISGLAFSFDQRAVFFSLIPFSTLLISPVALREKKYLSVLKILACCSLAPVLCLAYLYKNSALEPFIEQTLIFPLNYRSASHDVLTRIVNWLNLHSPLLTQNLLLTILALLGLTYLIRKIRVQNSSTFQEKFLFLILVPIVAITFFCDRFYPYYTAPYLPYLVLLSTYHLETLLSKNNKRIFRLTLVTAILIPCFAIIESTRYYNQLKTIPQPSDGAKELVEYLSQPEYKQNSLLIWGYRPDIYVRLEKLAPNPFMNRIMIHPDQDITTPEERQKHIYPKYLTQFKTAISTNPPELVLDYVRGKRLTSEADTLIQATLNDQNKYTLVRTFSGKNMIGEDWEGKVYRLVRPSGQLPSWQ